MLRYLKLPQPAASLFAKYIEAHKDRILSKWMHEVSKNNNIPSIDKLSTNALLDHLPKIMNELCNLLREHNPAETSNDLEEDSESHGKERWQQGFSLKDVLFEIEQIRIIILFDMLRAFSRENPLIENETLHRIEFAIYKFCGQLIVESAVEHTEFSKSELRAYTEKLNEINKQLHNANRKLSEKEARVRELSLRDPLTAVFNRRHLDNQLTWEIQRARRYDEPLTIVMLDLDNFKLINDVHGHEVGDRVLQYVAANLEKHCRAPDFIARYGGEEFTLLLPATTLETAKLLVERIRSSLAERLISPLNQSVTGSFGLAQWNGNENAVQLLTRADRAMYRAKSEGRNRLVADRSETK